jgi:hypothetical protein
MRTVTALFDSYDHATSAVRSLAAYGVAAADVSLVANNVSGDIETPGAEDGAAAGAGVGIVAGGGAGLLAGLGALAIPGIGPVIAGGWLLATAVGALAGAAVGGAAGGLVGALANAGVPEADAHVYAEGVRRGGTLLSVRAADDHAEAVADILHRAEGVDIDARRADYLTEGWTGFDEDATALAEEHIRDYRSSYGLLPPIV